MAGGGAQAVDIVAEIDVRQIAAEDLVLAQPGLEPERDQRLLDLADRGAVGAEEAGLGELLADRAAALAHPAGAQVAHHRPGDAPGVDADMAVEAPVLDGEKGLADMRRQLGDRHRLADDRAAAGDRLAVGRQDGEAGRAARLERARQGRGDEQPDDDDPDRDEADLDCALDLANA